MEFQAENILIRAADLGKLYEGVLNAASKGDGLTQQRWVIPELILQEARESGKTLMVFSHFVAQMAKTHQTAIETGETSGAQGRELRSNAPRSSAAIGMK